MIELKNVSYKYKNGENVLENINLEIKERRSACNNSEKMALESLLLQD